MISSKHLQYDKNDYSAFLLFKIPLYFGLFPLLSSPLSLVTPKFLLIANIE